MRLKVTLGAAVALVFSLLIEIAEAQVSVAWAARYRGPALSDNANAANALVADRFGNVYVTGGSAGIGSADYATIKYNHLGDSVWVRRRLNGAGGDLVVDSHLNVYVTGGPATIKYDSSGNELWARRNPNRYAGFTSLGKRILLSDSGYVYVSGQGVGLGGNPDVITWKLDTEGNILWMAQYDGRDHDADRMYDMALDPSGNIIVVGETYIAAPQSGYDYITIKYAPNGDTLWTRRYDAGVNGWDSGRGVAVDSSGNVYVTGWSDSTGTGSDALTIKYDPDGNVFWTARYNSLTNGGDTGDDIVVDRFGNVYVTGISQSINYAVHKYDSHGVHQWTQVYQGGGPAFAVRFPRISIDSVGNVYATVRVPECQFYSDFGVVKYDANGNRIWLATYGRPCDSEDAYALAVDENGNVYLTGYLGRSGNNFDYLTVKFVQDPVSVDNDEADIPTSLVLHQNYPNPFNSATRIDFSLPRSGYVTLRVFNTLGQEIATLVNGERVAGQHSVSWNASGLASGVYCYQLKAGDFVQTKKLILLR